MKYHLNEACCPHKTKAGPASPASWMFSLLDSYSNSYSYSYSYCIRIRIQAEICRSLRQTAAKSFSISAII